MLIDLWQWNIAETRAVYVFHVGGVDRWESVISGEGRGKGGTSRPATRREMVQNVLVFVFLTDCNIF